MGCLKIIPLQQIRNHDAALHQYRWIVHRYIEIINGVILAVKSNNTKISTQYEVSKSFE
jgi:hypothetical protein